MLLSTVMVIIIRFKIIDSHARDLYGRGHPQGTCALLEIPSLISLVHYFPSIQNNIINEYLK